MKTKRFLTLAIITVVTLVFSACAPPPSNAPANSAPAANAPASSTGEFTVPHPILSKLEVRQAIAECIDRDALIASVYPYVEDKSALRMDTFVPKTHWAYKGNYQDYKHDVEAAGKLLDAAGWKYPADAKPGPGVYRQNDKGDSLKLTLTTTNSQLRQTWAAVAEQNLAECGILLVRQHVPASFWFGDTTGLKRRDFEMGAYAWVGQADPGGQTLYACNQIPTPKNNWEGQNVMGWCNQKASDNIVLANNTLKRDERIKAYDIVQQEFAKDMVSLPLFQRAEAQAWSNKLEGLKVDPTEYGTASAVHWKMSDGGDTAVLGFTQEPSTLFQLVVDAAVAREVGQLIFSLGTTQYNYDYQPVTQKGLSTIEAGLATDTEVDVKPGDMVWTADGDAAKLEKGTKIILNGETKEYDGSSPLKLPQLTVKYAYSDTTWSDGTPVSQDDLKLGYKINCDPDSGATSFITCHSIAKVDWGKGLDFTVTYVPGNQNPTYYLAPSVISSYPSHQKLSDGRLLKDVPAKEWQTLPEVTEKPLGDGPYIVKSWQKGQNMQLTVNPNYKPQPAIKNITIVFIPDTNQAVAQLISGDVDYLDTASLGGGPEVQTVLDATKEGKVKSQIVASPTWEHIDFNLYSK
ncbi:MAG: ABC transporter substrate-binding protein [Caldilineaceae bacterium]